MNRVAVTGFTVVGREARTSNMREMSGEGVIGKMWSSVVPAGSPVVAVYSAYESDKDGEYDYLLGRKMGNDETVASELAQRIVEAGTYRAFAVRRAGIAGSRNWFVARSLGGRASGQDSARLPDGF